MYVSAVKAVADVQNLSIQFPILNKDLDVFHNFDVTCKNDEKTDYKLTLCGLSAALNIGGWYLSLFMVVTAFLNQ